jgi:hypothetical protein
MAALPALPASIEHIITTQLHTITAPSPCLSRSPCRVPTRCQVWQVERSTGRYRRAGSSLRVSVCRAVWMRTSQEAQELAWYGEAGGGKLCAVQSAQPQGLPDGRSGFSCWMPPCPCCCCSHKSHPEAVLCTDAASKSGWRRESDEQRRLGVPHPGAYQPIKLLSWRLGMLSEKESGRCL